MVGGVVLSTMISESAEQPAKDSTPIVFKLLGKVRLTRLVQLWNDSVLMVVTPLPMMSSVNPWLRSKALFSMVTILLGMLSAVMSLQSRNAQ